MPIELIGVGQGLVQSKDPSHLDDGELSRADDSHYEPNDFALHKNNGRTRFNSTDETNGMAGIRYLEFDGSATDLFVLRTEVSSDGATASYRTANAAKTGTFSDLVTNLSPGATTLDSVHYNNEHFLLDGINRNRMIDSTGAASLHGMLANTAAPTLDRDGGDLSGLTVTSGTTYAYWIAEEVRDASNVFLRFNASASNEVVTLTGDGTLDKVRITRPAIVSSDATHRVLFSTGPDGAFPTGAEITSAPIATLFLDDTRGGTDPALPAGDLYETNSVSIAGVKNNVSRNGPPPISTTGDVLEDSLVLNDTSDLRLVKYSYIDEPNKFPAHNFIRMETGEQDEVRLIRRLGRIIIVGMRDSIWRINTLPRAEDSAFETERVKEQVDGAFGVVSPMAAATFSFGQGMRLAYGSLYGLVVTDGFTWDVLTDDLKWKESVEISTLSKSYFRDNPSEYRLEFYVTPKGGSSNSIAYYLHYHPSHAKRAEGGGFRAKVTGPNHVNGVVAMSANIGGERFIFTGDGSGLYLEGDGPTDNSNAGGIRFVCRTKDLYLNGVGGEAEIRKLWTHHSAASGQTATNRVVQQAEGLDDQPFTRTIKLDRREMTQGPTSGLGDSYQIGVENSDAAGSFAVNHFVVQWESAEEVQSG